jgi:Tfp pilus assembly protein PilV
MSKFFKQKNRACSQCIKHSFSRRGFTLVETLVAISIFTMSILGMISILASGVSDISYAKQKIAASYLAQEGIEYVRNMRDTAVLYNATDAQHGWDAFKPTLPTSPSTTFYRVSSDFSNFTRTISADITTFGSNEVKITSTVSWTQGSGNYSISLSEDLFNWVE